MKSLQLKALSVLAATGLGGIAAADGFSATLDVPILPQFSVAPTLNYSLEVVPQVFVGGSLGLSVAPVSGGIGVGISGRLGAKYIGRLLEQRDLNADWYGGLGANLTYSGAAGFVGNPDVNAGARAVYTVAPQAKVYGGVDGAVVLNTVLGAFQPQLGGYVGAKFEPVNNLEAYAQVNGTYFFNPGAFNYDARLGVYYAFTPQFKLGANTGFENGGFKFGLSAQFAEKPGTLATPGNYLP